MTTKSVECIVKGTYYYGAERLFSSNALRPKVKVKLLHQPLNPYDKNAVAVHLDNSGEMIGHLPREMAANFLQSIASGLVTNASVSRVYRADNSLKIYISISWLVARKPVESNKIISTDKSRIDQKRKFQRLKPHELAQLEVGDVAKLIDVENCMGVYAIRCEINGWIYVGSSLKIRDRLSSHFSLLSRNRHGNSGLQADYSNYGPSSFTFFIVRDIPSQSLLLEAEQTVINEYQSSGTKLYNMTSDGQGRIPSMSEVSYAGIKFPLLRTKNVDLPFVQKAQATVSGTQPHQVNSTNLSWQLKLLICPILYLISYLIFGSPVIEVTVMFLDGLLTVLQTIGSVLLQRLESKTSP
jgi:GIY-YIG catalytic domain/HIRAN domain